MGSYGGIDDFGTAGTYTGGEFDPTGGGDNPSTMGGGYPPPPVPASYPVASGPSMTTASPYTYGSAADPNDPASLMPGGGIDPSMSPGGGAFGAFGPTGGGAGASFYGGAGTGGGLGGLLGLLGGGGFGGGGGGLGGLLGLLGGGGGGGLSSLFGGGSGGAGGLSGLFGGGSGGAGGLGSLFGGAGGASGFMGGASSLGGAASGIGGLLTLIPSFMTAISGKADTSAGGIASSGIQDALAGAGLGTMIFPGIGTAVGAGLGALLGIIPGLTEGGLPKMTKTKGFEGALAGSGDPLERLLSQYMQKGGNANIPLSAPSTSGFQPTAMANVLELLGGQQMKDLHGTTLTPPGQAGYNNPVGLAVRKLSQLQGLIPNANELNTSQLKMIMPEIEQILLHRGQYGHGLQALLGAENTLAGKLRDATTF